MYYTLKMMSTFDSPCTYNFVLSGVRPVVVLVVRGSPEGPLVSRVLSHTCAPETCRSREERPWFVPPPPPRHGPLVGTQSGQNRGRLEAIQDDNRADQKNWIIGDNLVQIGPIGKNNPWWNAALRRAPTPQLYALSQRRICNLGQTRTLTTPFPRSLALICFALMDMHSHMLK